MEEETYYCWVCHEEIQYDDFYTKEKYEKYKECFDCRVNWCLYGKY